MANILSDKDLADITITEQDIIHPEGAQLLETVIRMECSFFETPEVHTYRSLYNAFTFLYKQVKKISPHMGKRCREALLPIRMNHIGAGSARHKILLNGIKERSKLITLTYSDIVKNKIYEDPSLIKASAHWLKFESNEFYKESEIQNKQVGVNFVWGGLEKAVGFAGMNNKGKPAFYVIVMSDDLQFEENLAQYAGGILSQDDINKKAKEIRETLTELHKTPYFCILEPKEKTA